MGALSADDDGRKPDGLTSAHEPVPAPWGQVVVPDDISELDDEVAQVRRELRTRRRRKRLSRWFGITDPSDGPGVVGPLFIVAVAMTLALTSLFGGFWPYQPADRTTGDGAPPSAGQQLPELVLTDAYGAAVPLRDLRPVVIIAVGRCACTNLIAEAAALARHEKLTLAVVGQPNAPTLAPAVEGDQPEAVRSLADPRGVVARTVVPDRAPRTGTAVVVLVARDGVMTQVLNDVQSVEEFAAGARQLS